MKNNNCKCLLCSKEFYVKPFALTRGRGRFCSKKCQYKFKENKIEKVCPQCNKTFIIKASDSHKYIRCSISCNKEHRTINKKIKIKKGVSKGSRHWNWKGGITPEREKIRRSKKYFNFRKSIFERDNYTCVDCGKKHCYLQVEHIKPFSLFPELIYEKNNCKTLCLSCHYKTDSFGYKLMHKINKYGKEKIREEYQNIPNGQY